MAASLKRILVVTHYYPPHIGGIEKVAEKQATMLSSNGYEVAVITSRVSHQEKSGTFQGVRVIRIPALNLTERIGVPFPIFSPSLVTHLIREIRTANVVHIHDVFYLSSFVAAVIASLYRKPVVVMQHVAMVEHSSSFVMFAQRVVYKTTGWFILHVAKKVITLNDRVEKFMKELGVSDSKLVPLANGVDQSLFHPATLDEKIAIRKKYNIASERKIALFVGRFVQKKGFQKLINASSSDYQIVFVGGDKQEVGNEQISFLGKLGQSECSEVYRASDLFILPSEGEGFPLSIQEAMASGLPIVTTNDPGYQRYGFDRNLFILLDSTESANLRDALTALFADEEKLQKMSQYSLEYVKKNFDWDIIIAKLEDIYSESLS